MKIESVKDIREIVDEMHDSEFSEADFRFDSNEKTFFLKSYSPISKKQFLLRFYNVEKYQVVNLDKIREGKATGGIFNDIRIRNGGLNLTLLSQDLRIIIELSKIEGKLTVSDD